MPRYAALIYTDAATEGEGTPEQWAQIMAEYNEFGEKGTAAGVIVGGEALEPTSTATTVHVKGGALGGEAVTTDGPFAETKEVLGGFYLLQCSDLDDAIERANATSYGLNASVWSGSGCRGREVAARLRAGTVNVNEGYAAAWGSIDAPMGGMGDSGMGRRHGAHGLDKYTEAQTVAEQRLFNLAPPFPQLGDRGFAEVMTSALRVLKRVGWR